MNATKKIAFCVAPTVFCYVIAFCDATGAHAQQSKPAPRPVAATAPRAAKVGVSAPVRTLQAAGTFAIGGVSVGGQMGDGEAALRRILATKTAARDLETVIQTGTPEGRLYAYLGLKHAAPLRFRALAPVYEASKAFVHVMSGCEGLEQQFGSVAREIGQDGPYSFSREIKRPASARELARPVRLTTAEDYRRMDALTARLQSPRRNKP